MASILDIANLPLHTSPNDPPSFWFLDRCKNEHPGQTTVGSGNRFGALSGGGFGGKSLFLLVVSRIQSSVFIHVHCGCFLTWCRVCFGLNAALSQLCRYHVFYAEPLLIPR